MYNETELTSLQLSGDFLLKYDRKLGAGFNLTANLGGSITIRSFVQTIMTAEQLKQPGIYSLANSVNRIKTDNYSYERQTNSIYGLVSLSWRDAVYLDITAATTGRRRSPRATTPISTPRSRPACCSTRCSFQGARPVGRPAEGPRLVGQRG